MYTTKAVLKNVNKSTQIGKVYVEITFLNSVDRERIYIPTSEAIHKKNWRNGRVATTTPVLRDVSNRVENIHQSVRQQLYEIDKKHNTVNPELFREFTKGGRSKEKDLITLFDEFISLKKLTAKHKTVIKLTTIKNNLIDFLGSRKVFLENYNQTFINKLTHYWQNTRKLQPNTIHKNFRFIIMFLNHLRKEGIIENDRYLSLDYPRTVTTNTIALSKLEVKKLMKYSPHDERMKRTKDLFLIMIFTGLRFSDAVRITKSWRTNDLLIIHTQKTDAKVVIPIHDALKEILDEYDFNLANLKVSNQKFNISIKLLCERAGIDSTVEVVKYSGSRKYFVQKRKYELISSHTARRTFITNSIIAGLPLTLIMKITGHKKLSTLQKYVDLAESFTDQEFRKLSEYFK